MSRTLAAAAAAVLALSLAACSDDEPEPKFAPTESTSPSTEPTTTETAKQEPWQKNTRAGAVAFVKHWFAVFSDSMDDGDVAELREISAPDCVTCVNFADRLEAIYIHGGFYKSSGWKVIRASSGSTEGLDPGEQLILAKVNVAAERSKEDADAEVIVNPTTQASYTARLQWADGTWIMNSLVRVT